MSILLEQDTSRMGSSGSMIWRDVTSCHLNLGIPVTIGYYRVLSDQTISKNIRNLQRSPAISSYL
eukprot:660533-Amorphochlora_amoeboformis.AAC.1